MFNDSSIRSMMQQSFNIYPDHAVKPGDTWSRKFTIVTGMIDMEMDNKYKLVSAANGVAHIEVDSKIAGKPGAQVMQQMKVEMNGTQKGTMDVDVSTGLITDSKMKQEMKGKLSAMGMEMPMEISSDIHITGKKI